MDGFGWCLSCRENVTFVTERNFDERMRVTRVMADTRLGMLIKLFSMSNQYHPGDLDCGEAVSYFECCI
jgi:hypothetical protein